MSANLTKRFFSPPQDSYFIFGPRGTGKSTWIKQNLQNAIVINLLSDKVYRQHLANPEHIKSLVAANKDIHLYVIDEIQKVPQILDAIHDLIEQNKELQFVLTGSSSRKLKKTGVNLMAGRALLTNFHPFMASELKQKFNLNCALKNGLIPLIVNATDPQKKMTSYINLYLKEEVKAEGLVRDLGTFALFLEKISFSHSSVMNLNSIARECLVSRKIVENYISILEDLLLAYKLPVFTKRAKREVSAHPKFYLFDTGVYYHLRPKGPLEKHEQIDGIALEGLVLQNLRAWCDYSTVSDLQCYFWRTKGGAEIDFIIYGQNHFYAIEVKNSTIVHKTHLKHLKSFCSDYPEATPVLLYRGNEKLLINNILCWPVEDFLVNLVPNHWPINPN